MIRERILMAHSVFDKLSDGTITAESLAKKAVIEPSLVPKVIDSISSHEAKAKFACAKALRLLSKEKPEILYQEFDHFVKLMDSTNNIIKRNAIDVLANLAAVDDKNKFEAIFHKYFELLQDRVMITAAHVVDNSSTIAKSKPDLTLDITASLLKVERAQRSSPECREILIGKAIVAFDGYFEQIEDKAKILAFVKRQTSSRRNATKVKAHRFLKKRAQR
jgi:hypothetical protein